MDRLFIISFFPPLPHIYHFIFSPSTPSLREFKISFNSNYRTINEWTELPYSHSFTDVLFSPQLRNGNVHYISDAGVVGKVERTIADTVVSDGQWHTLQLQKNGSATVLQVDSGHPRVIQHTTQDFGGLSVVTFSLGGIPPGPAQQKTAAGEKSLEILYVWPLDLQK